MPEPVGRRAEVVDDHLRAVRGEQTRMLAADAASCSGHDRDPTLTQPAHRVRSSVLRAAIVDVRDGSCKSGRPSRGASSGLPLTCISCQTSRQTTCIARIE